MLSFAAPRVAHEQTPVNAPEPTSTSSPIIETPAPTPGPKKVAVPAILEKIAHCESGGKQFNKNGGVIRGIMHPADIGKYQINMSVWSSEAERLGIDLMTEEGNEAMALELFHRAGTAPWVSSKPCWGPTK